MRKFPLFAMLEGRSMGMAILLVLLLGQQATTKPRSCPFMGTSSTPKIERVDVDLNGEWKMKDFSKGMGLAMNVQRPGKIPADCIPCQVPGTVRKALLAAGEIPDPYFGYDNEKSLWIEDKEWWFFKSFSAGEAMQGKWVDLMFEGTSFQGEVWLNGVLVGELKGMLNPRSFDVSKALRYNAENELAVRLEATPDARMNTVARNLTWDSPRDQLYSIAQCMYGWDWGPHGVPIGLWRPVHLCATGPVRIDHPYVRSRILSTDTVECAIDVDIHNLSQGSITGVVQGRIQDKETGAIAAEFQQSYEVSQRESKTVPTIVKIIHPKLWWPNGMGGQPLYVLHAQVASGRTVSDEITSQFGIRELKLVQNEHVEEFLKSMKNDVGSQYALGNVVGSYPWTFQINGRKMFAKGGNWIPIDQMLQLERGRYDRLLSLAKDAGFNLLRVWGGGLYETDEFYELCDTYGILAWQEFLSNRSFSHIDRENFLEGASSAITRIRNHPSLTFWCGGNEFDPDDAGSKSVIDALGGLLKQLDPQREFHRASPYQGDDHYWGVWHGLQPYTTYRVVRPFRSEAGVNTFPVPENYRKFTPPSLLWPLDTTYVEYHGEYNVRFQHVRKLSRYANEFGLSSSIDEFIGKSEMYQALANAFNVEFCRTHKFRNSGCLIWQYNDIWPCVSWSLVDWYGTPKPSYYYVKRAARPVHVAVDFKQYMWKAGETFSADINVLNDADVSVSHCVYDAKILDIAGHELASQHGIAQAEANQSARVGSLTFQIPESMVGEAFFLSAEIKDQEGKLLSSVLYPIGVETQGTGDEHDALLKTISRMPQTTLTVECLSKSFTKLQTGSYLERVKIENHGSMIGYNVRLRFAEEFDSVDAMYSDNYVSLLPGESTTIVVELRPKPETTMPSELHLGVSGWNCPMKAYVVSRGNP